MICCRLFLGSDTISSFEDPFKQAEGRLYIVQVVKHPATFCERVNMTFTLIEQMYPSLSIIVIGKDTPLNTYVIVINVYYCLLRNQGLAVDTFTVKYLGESDIFSTTRVSSELDCFK